MSTALVKKWQHKAEMAKKASARAREKAGELMKTTLDAGIAGGTAFGLGALHARAEGEATPEKAKEAYSIFGIPLPLAVAAAAHGAALFGVGHGMEQHFRSAGNGAIAAHLFLTGQHLARQKWAKVQDVSGAGISTAELLSSV